MSNNNHKSTGLISVLFNTLKPRFTKDSKSMFNNNHQNIAVKTAAVNTAKNQIQRNHKTMLNKICQFLGLATAAASVLVCLSPASAQTWQTFSVQDGMALNTNNLFRRIDGQPRMSIYRRNDSDIDQQFERLQGKNGAFLLKHRSTYDPNTKKYKCLNGHRLEREKEINVWPCDVNDPDQNWNIIPLGDGYNLIQRAGSVNKAYPNGLCVDTPTRQNEGKVHLWDCDRDNSNQRWKSSVSNVNPTSGQINLPFRSGQTWYVCQGYRGGASHYYENASRYHNIYSLDLTVENNSWNSVACHSNDSNLNKSAGYQILAPVSGNVARVSWADDLVCLTNDSRTKSFMIGHMTPSTRVFGRVNQDAVIGTVKKYTTKNGYAHIHIAAYNGAGCTGASIPFTDANGIRFNGAPNLPSLDTPTSKPMNQHRGTVLRR